MRYVLKVLAQTTHAPSVGDQMEWLTMATSRNPDIALAVMNFKNQTEVGVVKTYELLVASITRQLNNLPRTYGTSASRMSMSNADSLVETQQAQIAKLTAQVAMLTANAARGVEQGGITARTKKVYCFVHGFCMHGSNICENMKNDPIYTDAMKAATGVCGLKTDGPGSIMIYGKGHVSYVKR